MLLRDPPYQNDETVFFSGVTNRTFSPTSARTTLMLGQLLDGYDKRLRPNFGGKRSLQCLDQGVDSFSFSMLSLLLTKVVHWQHKGLKS